MEHSLVFESRATFGFPAEIVDRYLDAPEVELRLILFLFRHSNNSFLTEDVAQRLGVDEKRLEQAFDYWISKGVLYYAAGKYMPERPRMTATDYMRYSPELIAKRIDTDDALHFLYQKAETIFDRTLSATDASAILSMVDWNGLPVEVVLLLLQYCKDNGKSMRQAEKLAIDWAEHQINTYEAAEAYIRREHERKKLCNQIASRLGINNRALTDGELKVFNKWTETFGFDLSMIMAAYEQTVKSTGKYAYPYMDKILTEWHGKGWKLPEDVQDVAPKKKKQGQRYASNIPIDTQRSEALSWEIVQNTLKEIDDE